MSERLLLRLSGGQVCFIVDLELLNRDVKPSEAFDWLFAFLGLFRKLEARRPPAVVKVLPTSYSAELPFESCETTDFSRFCITARMAAGKTKRRRRQAQGSMSQGRNSRSQKYAAA